VLKTWSSQSSEGYGPRTGTDRKITDLGARIKRVQINELLILLLVSWKIELNKAAALPNFQSLLVPLICYSKLPKQQCEVGNSESFFLICISKHQKDRWVLFSEKSVFSLVEL